MFLISSNKNINNIEKNIYIIKNFLPNSMHEYLWGKINNSVEDDWKIIKPNYSFNVPLKIENDEITSFAKNKLYSIFGDYMYNGFQNIIEMPKNSNMFLHNDDEKDIGIELGMAYHLNDDFEGGEIFYSNKNITHKPIANSIVIHPGTVEYTHGIHEITNGTRYSINTFAYTKNNLEYYSPRRKKYMKKALESI